MYLQAYLTPPVSREQQSLCNIDESQFKFAQKLVEITKTVAKENKQLKRKCETLEAEHASIEEEVEILNKSLNEATDMLSVKTDNYVKVIREQQHDKTALRNEIQKYETESKEQNNEIERLVNEIQTVRGKLSKSNSRNLNKKLKRRDENIQKLKDEVAVIKNENSVLLSDIQKHTQLQETATGQTETLKRQKQQLQKNQYKLKASISNLKQECNELKEENDIEKMRLKDELKEQRDRVSQLEAVVRLMESETVSTFEDGKYSNEVRECCIALLTECNVSLNKLPDIIRHVLKSFTGKEPERLPSKTMLSGLMAEAKVIASHHVAAEMLKDFDSSLNNTGHCLHQDATSKYHSHYEGAQVTLKDGRSLSIGLKQVAGSDGQTYIQSVQEMFSDLALSLGQGKEENTAKLVCSIKNLMSDQCASNKIFNDGIEEYRRTLLPAIVKNFEDLSENEKNSLSGMGRFACRLHLLANFGSEADKAMLAFENSVCEGKNPYSYGTESGAFRLCRTAAKAFTRRGCEKAGVPDYFEPFLKGRERVNRMITFHGHRINLIFHDGAAVFHHRKDISDFLKDWPDPNLLLQSVKFDIHESAYLAGCRALGIFDKLVTGPFWQLLESEESILCMNKHLYQMQLTLAAWSQNGELPLSGESMFGGCVEIKKDELYDSLFTDSTPTMDALTVLALELLSAQLLILLERQAKTQLPEGEYWDPSEEIRSASANVPTTNTVSERDMAVLDNLLKIKPSASNLTLEVIVMCTKNKPLSWLRSLPEDEKNTILDKARQMAPEIKQQFQDRKQVLEEKIKEKLNAKKEKVANKEKKEQNINFKLSREISKYGGPWTEGEVEIKLNQIDEKQRHAAVLTQIKFHKSILKSKGPRELFTESIKGRKRSLDELIQNFNTILQLNSLQEVDNEKGLVYKEMDDWKEAVDEKKTEIE